MDATGAVLRRTRELINDGTGDSDTPNPTPHLNSVEEIFKTILAECGEIDADRFLILLSTFVAMQEAEARGKRPRNKRRTYAYGYALGQAATYRDVLRFLELFKWVRDSRIPMEMIDA